MPFIIKMATEPGGFNKKITTAFTDYPPKERWNNFWSKTWSTTSTSKTWISKWRFHGYVHKINSQYNYLNMHIPFNGKLKISSASALKIVQQLAEVIR